MTPEEMGVDEYKRVTFRAEQLGVSASWVKTAERLGMTPQEMEASAAANVAESALLLEKRFEEGGFNLGDGAPFSKSRAAPHKAFVPPASAARRAK